jgi:hypothetical protein
MFVHSQLSRQCVQQHLRSQKKGSVGILTQVTRLGRHDLPAIFCTLYRLALFLIQEQSLDKKNTWKGKAIRACRNSPTFMRLKHPLLCQMFSLSLVITFFVALKSAMKIHTQNFAQWTPFRGQNNGLYITPTPTPSPPTLPSSHTSPRVFIHVCIGIYISRFQYF